MGLIKAALVMNAVKSRGDDIQNKKNNILGQRFGSHDSNDPYAHPPPPPPGQHYQQQPYYHQQPQYYQQPPQGYGPPPGQYYRDAPYNPQDNYGQGYGHPQQQRQGPPPPPPSQQQGQNAWPQYAYPPPRQSRSTSPYGPPSGRPRETYRDAPRGVELQRNGSESQSDDSPPPYYPRDEIK